MLASLFGTGFVLAGQEALLVATRKPGVIVGPIATFLGAIYNFLFNFIYGISPTGSLVIAIVLFTVLVRLVLTPLMVKQQKSTYMMQKIQPEMTKIQNKYKNKKDPESQRKMAYEIQKLQKDNGVNMLGGCLPMLIQLPILYALFYIFQKAYIYVDVIGQNYSKIADVLLSIPVEARVNLLKPIALANNLSMDLAVRDDILVLINTITSGEWTTIINNAGTQFAALLQPLVADKNLIEFFFGINLVAKAGWHFPGILIPIAAGLTTFLSSKIMMTRQKKSQVGAEKNSMTSSMDSMMYIMPVIMAAMCVNFPAALGVYWTVSNIIQIAQTAVLNKMFDKKYGVIGAAQAAEAEPKKVAETKADK